MISVDTYLQPGAPDPVLETDMVLDIARRHAPAVSTVLHVDESGGEARAYLLDGNAILKTQRPHRLRPRTSLAKEALILDHLAQSSSLPVPRILGYGQEGSVEYILMSRMAGVAMHNATLSPDARAAALHQLGRVLRQLHGVDQDALLSTGLIAGDSSSSDLSDRLVGAYDRLIAALQRAGGWPAALPLGDVSSRALAALPRELPFVVLHSNPSAVHTFVDASSGAFTGIIDFGDAYRSHPALDLRAWADPADALELRAGYVAAGPLPVGFEQVWRAGQVLTEMALAVRGQRDLGLAARNIRGLLDRGATVPAT